MCGHRYTYMLKIFNTRLDKYILCVKYIEHAKVEAYMHIGFQKEKIFK